MDPVDIKSIGCTDGIWSRLKDTAVEMPKRTALITDTGENLAYLEVVERIARCAAGLQASECVAGNAVVVMLDNSLDFVIACFAVWMLGAIVVPVNPHYKDDEIRHIFESISPKLVLHSQSLRMLVITALPGVPHFESTAALEIGSPLKNINAYPSAPALHMFSSGTTGKPKRVTRSQTQLLCEFDALAKSINVGPSDRFLCTIPLYHAHGFCTAMVAGLLSGAGMVLAKGEFNARATVALLERYHITIYPSVPLMIRMLSEIRFSAPPALAHLRLVFSAGAPLPKAVASRFAERFNITVGQLYGSTESGAVTLNIHHQADKPESVGRPLAGFEIQIRSELGQKLPPRQLGEIWVRTPATTLAYDGLPELSADVFVGEYFFTGDLGWNDEDGDLYISGRKKLLINVAGNKVDPLEVEEVLGAHPSVAEVVVIGKPHRAYGEMVKAVVVSACADMPEDPEVLLSFCAERLAEYKIPKVIEFRDEIPRSPLGKILRKYL